MIKRILSVILCVLLTLTLLPTAAHAAKEISRWYDLEKTISSSSQNPDNPTEIKLTNELNSNDRKSNFLIKSGRYVILDLNGHDLDCSDCQYTPKIEGCLIITDSSEEQKGRLIYNRSNYNMGFLCTNGGSLTLDAGTITGSNVIEVIRVDGESSFTMNGGEVTGNNVEKNIRICDRGSFTMNGGTVDGSGYEIPSDIVSIGEDARCVLTGGSILCPEGNRAIGVEGSISVSGAPELAGKGILLNNSLITIAGALTNSDRLIPVEMRTPGVFTDGWSEDMGNPADYFKSADDCYSVELNGAGEAYLKGKSFVVTLDSQGATTPGTASVEATYGSPMPEITPPTKTGYAFDGYFTGNWRIYNANGTGAMNWIWGESRTLYAGWNKLYSVSTQNAAGGSVTADRAEAVRGETVTLTPEPAAGYRLVPGSLTVSYGDGQTVIPVEGTGQNDGKWTFSMPEADVTVTAAWEKGEPNFATKNLVLSGSIGLSFNMNLPEIDGVDYSTSYMTFSIPHGTVTERVDYSESQTKSSGNRAFVAYVSSIQMAEPVTATFHYFENGAEKTVTDVYSVADYFEAFDAIADQFDEETQALVRAVADYGHYVQPFLAEARGWELGKDYATLDKCYHEGDYDLYDVECDLSGKEVTITGDAADEVSVTYSLTLDSDTVINVYFRPSGNISGDFAASIDGGEAFCCEKDSQDRYVVRIKDIAAHMLGRSYTIELFTNCGRATICISALSYVKAALEYYNDTNDPDMTARNAVAAIVAYYQAAEAYVSTH